MPTPSTPVYLSEAVLPSQGRPTCFYLMSRESPLSQTGAGTSSMWGGVAEEQGFVGAGAAG